MPALWLAQCTTIHATVVTAIVTTYNASKCATNDDAVYATIDATQRSTLNVSINSTHCLSINTAQFPTINTSIDIPNIISFTSTE